MIEPGDLVDRLFKNPEAIWNICKRAPHSIVVMDALLVVLANKKVMREIDQRNKKMNINNNGDRILIVWLVVRDSEVVEIESTHPWCTERDKYHAQRYTYIRYNKCRLLSSLQVYPVT